MRTRSAVVLGLSATLLPLTFVGPARAQSRANVGRQMEGQVLSNVGNAVAGQPAGVVPGQPGAVYPGQPGAVYPGQPAGYGLPATPRQAVQGMERQAINSVTGQPAYMPQAGSAVRYQLPPQYAASAPGTTVNYGGANYVINADRTMSPVAAAAQPAAAQPAANAARYQIPPQYAASAPGTTVTYGGANYVINADRTMSPAAAAAQPAANATRYQIPAQFAGSAPGSTISYGGANYVINNDNTMSPGAR